MALLLLVAAIVCFIGAALFSAPAFVVPLGLAFVAAALAYGPAEKFLRR